MSQRLDNMAATIETRFGDTVERIPSTTGQLVYGVSADALIGTATALRDEPALAFEMLMDLCGVDYLDYGQDEWTTASATHTGYSRGVIPDSDTGRRALRFAVVVNLLSVTHNLRLRLRIFCPDDERPIVPTLTSVWASADWFEREAFDLYGILFDGHPDLRRLLTDYGFIGHPFRKDFPLSGNVEVRYDPEEGRVVYQPVSIEPRTLVPKVIRKDNRYDEALKDRETDG